MLPEEVQIPNRQKSQRIHYQWVLFPDLQQKVFCSTTHATFFTYLHSHCPIWSSSWPPKFFNQISALQIGWACGEAVKMPFRTPASQAEVPNLKSLVLFWLGFLPLWLLETAGSLVARGDLDSRLPAFPGPAKAVRGNQRSEAAHGRATSLSFLLFQLSNKNSFKKHNNM